MTDARGRQPGVAGGAAPTRSVKEMEARSVKEMEARSVEEMEARSVEEMEARSVEEMEARSVEEMEARSVEEMEARSVDGAPEAHPVDGAPRAAELGVDGLRRCPWGFSTPEYVAYHDEEWGRPVVTDRGVFERLSLEAFQSGLSWLTILRKRENFRQAFGRFDMATVAEYGPDDVHRLLADAGIVRNRAKIDAVIANARAALALPDGLASTVWRYADPDAPAPRTLDDVPATTQGSTALSRELKRHGFRFVGPTTAYATMQACGLVDDHLAECFRRGAYAGSGPR